MAAPKPLISIALAPRTATDDDRLRQGLQVLTADDPTLRATLDEETGYTIVAGLGERHLEIIVERLKREFGVEASVSKPQIAYQEGLTRPADGEMKYAARTGGRDLCHVRVRVYPGEPGSGYVFENTTIGGALPDRCVATIAESIRDQASRGALAGHPIEDVRVELYDGSCHDGDASETPLQVASAMAFLDAARKAGPVLLEPLMRVDVTVPDEFVSAVLDDLTGRRGQVRSHDALGPTGVISAHVPLAGLSGFAATLRALTRGRGAYVTAFDRYEPLRRSSGGNTHAV